MKIRPARISALLVIAIVVLALTPSARLAAQKGATRGHHHYKLIDIGTFGGPNSSFNDGNAGSFSVGILNRQGAAAGSADTAVIDPYSPDLCFNEDCYVSHAFVWSDGIRTDLRPLFEGLSSQASWISDSGLVAGTSENGELDPLFSGFPEFHAVLWKDGQIHDLGTLPGGGYESSAVAVNSRGQAVGWAMNTVPDANSLQGPGLFPTQTRAFLWQNSSMQDLGTLGGTDAQAQFINERGDVVGWSYVSDAPNTSCPTIAPIAIGSFTWDEEHKMRDLGNLGGTCTIATGVNNRGTVVGFYVDENQVQHSFVWRDGTIRELRGSLGGDFTGPEGISETEEIFGYAYLPGNATFHASLWQSDETITDLGVIGDDTCSYASAMNAHRQIVGGSLANCNFDENAHGFLWDDGQLFDLNSLIPPGSSLHLQWGVSINDRGEIAGIGVDTNGDGNTHAFLLIPCDENHPNVQGCDYSPVDAATAENGTGSDASRRDASPAQPSVAIRTNAEEPSSELHASLGAANNPINGVLRRRVAWNRSLITPQASALITTTTATSLAITSGAPPNGTVGQPYGPFQFIWHYSIIEKFPVYYFPLSASGGSGYYSWSWAGAPGSTLPPGLTCCGLILQHGFPGPVGGIGYYYPEIHGWPTAAGTYHVIVSVTDSSSPPKHASAAYTITIFQ